MKYLRMDLKVCEGCGALWLRSRLSDGVYCRYCVVTLAEYPAPRGHRRPVQGRHQTNHPGRRTAAHSSSTGRFVAVAGGAR